MAYGEYETINDPEGKPRVLGKGSYGQVFLVRKAKLGRQYALKLLTNELLEKRTRARTRFMQEVETFASLTHPNIVNIADFGECGEGIFYVMEYCEGGSLDTHLRQRRALPVLLTLRLLEKTASALEYALGKNFVHRDIKPENLMLLSAAERDDDLPDRLRVIDFGLAKQVTRPVPPEPGINDTQLPSESQIVGTPLYMAPEQLRGLDADHRADIFSLGITAWHLLAGNTAFAHLTHTAQIRQDRCSAIPYNSKLPGHVAGRAREVIARMIEKDPARRYQTYQALRQALREAIAEETNTANPLPGSTPAVGSVPDKETSGSLPSGNAYHYTSLKPAGPDPATGGQLFHALCGDQPVMLLRLPTAHSPVLSRLLGRLDVPERPPSIIAYQRHTFSPSHPDFPGECVCTTVEESGPDLLAVIRSRKRTTLEEAKGLFQQLAEAFDFARTREISLLAGPGAVLLAGLSSAAAETPAFSAAEVRLYPTILETSAKDEAATLGATLAASSGASGSSVPTLRDFAALVYHVLAGRETDPGAFVSVRNYRGISSLQTKTDAIIRDTIANLRHPQSCRALLLNLCSSEGIRLPSRPLPSSVSVTISSGSDKVPQPPQPLVLPPKPVTPVIPPVPATAKATEDDPLLKSPDLWKDLPPTTRRRLQSCLRDIWDLRRDISKYHTTALSYSTHSHSRTHSQALPPQASPVLKEIEEASRDIEACRRTLHDAESRAMEAILQVRDTINPEAAEIRKKDIFALLEIAEHAHSDAIAHYQQIQSIPGRQAALLESISLLDQQAGQLVQRLGDPLPELLPSLTDPAILGTYAETAQKLEQLRQWAGTARVMDQARSTDSLHGLEQLQTQARTALNKAAVLETKALPAAQALRITLAASEREEQKRNSVIAGARDAAQRTLGEVEELIHQAQSAVRRAADIASTHSAATGASQHASSCLATLQSLRTDITEALSQINAGPTADAATRASSRAQQAATRAAATASESAAALQSIERLLRPAGERLSLARQSTDAALTQAQATLRQIEALTTKALQDSQSVPEGDRDPATLAYLDSETEAARHLATSAETAARTARQSGDPEVAETAEAETSQATAALSGIYRAVTGRTTDFQANLSRLRAEWSQLQIQCRTALTECRTVIDQARGIYALPGTLLKPTPEQAAALQSVTSLEGRLQALEPALLAAPSVREAAPLAQEVTALAQRANAIGTNLTALLLAHRQAEAEAVTILEAQRSRLHGEAESLARTAAEAAHQAAAYASRIDQHPATGASRPAALVHASEAQTAAARVQALLNSPPSPASLQEMQAQTRQAQAAATILGTLVTPLPPPKARNNPTFLLAIAAAALLLMGGLAWKFLPSSQPNPPAPNPHPSPPTDLTLVRQDPDKIRSPEPIPSKKDPVPSHPPAGQKWIVPDHFPTIQAAIAAAGPGQHISINAGTYQGPVTLKSGLRLTGANSENTTITADGLTYSTLTGKDVRDVIIENLAFQHPSNQNSPQGRPVVDLSGSSITFRDCLISSGVFDGVSISGSASKLVLDNCLLENHRNNALHVTLGATANLRQCTIRNNHLHGIVVNLNGSRAVIEDCRCENNSGSGVEVGGGGHLKATKLSCTGNAEVGWLVHGPGSHAILDSCEVIANTNGLTVNDSANVEIKSSRILRNKKAGINFVNASWLELLDSSIQGNLIVGVVLIENTFSTARARINGNTIRENGRAGIQVDGRGLTAEVRNNKIGPHGSYDIKYDQGSSGTVTGNTWFSKIPPGFDPDKIEASDNHHRPLP